MNLRQRKVAEDEAQPLPEMLLHALDDGICGPAIGALIVGIFDQRGRRMRAALYVIGVGDRNLQGRHAIAPYFGSRARASRMPSAPGLTAMGDRRFQAITPSRSITNSARWQKPSASR